jgi:Domain of unknown function (DUF4124)
MKLRRIARLVLLAPLMVGTMAAAQNLYKWVDENDRVTYSDQPPLGKVKSQEVVKILGSANTGAARQITDQDAQFKKRQDDTTKKQAESSKKEQFEAVRQDACNRARGELRALRDNVPIARMTESGEKVVLDDGAREAEGKRLETFIEESCSQSNG